MSFFLVYRFFSSSLWSWRYSRLLSKDAVTMSANKCFWWRHLDTVWIMAIRSAMWQATRSGRTVTVVTRTRASGWCTVSWIVVTAWACSTFALSCRWVRWSFWATVRIIGIAHCWWRWSVWIRILLFSCTWAGWVWYVIVTWSL